jgi:putative effector of murein hydrolase
LLCRVFHLGSRLTLSMLPKSVTTPIAMEIGEIQGAMSGLSLCVSGIITVLLSLFI